MRTVTEPFVRHAQGEWCPNMPDLPFVGKVQNEAKPQPIFETRVTGNDIEVNA